MTESKMTEILTEALYLFVEENEEHEENGVIRGVKTFEEAMVLTSNKGLVIRLEDGSEFQVTVVKSR